MLLDINDKILKLFLVYLKMLHHHVVTETIALVEELNVIKQMLAILFC
jgi:hypothetical protein